jgi:hypothetical protein
MKPGRGLLRRLISPSAVFSWRCRHCWSAAYSVMPANTSVVVDLSHSKQAWQQKRSGNVR